jgi:hypothetical protein
MKKITLLVLIFLSLAGCSGPIAPQEIIPTQIEISRQKLVSGIELTAIVENEGLPTLQPTANPLPAVGGIAGNLSYPSEFLPGMFVVAYRQNTSEYYFISTQDSQGSYQVDNLPPGIYHVVAYYQTLSAGYSQAVPCGLNVNCTDHGLIDVMVTAGNVTTGINPTDWYAPAGTFPTKPLIIR